MTYPVVWFEVLGRDAGRLQAFYRSVFGWSLDADNPARYGMTELTPSRGIPGGIGAQRAGDLPPWTTFYVESPDIAATLAGVAASGGRVLMPRTELPDVTLAVFADPEGNPVGLVEQRPR